MATTIAHVHASRRGRADPHDVAVHQHPQQLGLERRRHLAHLVEEQRAAVGRLEQPLAGAVGAGEGAALVAEELAFEQRLGEARRS